MGKYVKYEGTVYQTIIGPSKAGDELPEQTADATGEKHVPFIEETDKGYLVKVGKEVAHPMTAEHWIQFIEIEVDGKHIYRTMLEPTDAPEVMFKVPKGKKVIAREYCNLHGLWKG